MLALGSLGTAPRPGREVQFEPELSRVECSVSLNRTAQEILWAIFCLSASPKSSDRLFAQARATLNLNCLPRLPQNRGLPFDRSEFENSSRKVVRTKR